LIIEDDRLSHCRLSYQTISIHCI